MMITNTPFSLSSNIASSRRNVLRRLRLKKHEKLTNNFKMMKADVSVNIFHLSEFIGNLSNNFYYVSQRRHDRVRNHRDMEILGKIYKHH
jgi:hypothetical protein